MNRRRYKYEKRVRLDRPQIIGYMSVDGSRQYHHDFSELKYVSSASYGKVSMNLNHNIDKAVKRTTDDNVEKISLLLRFLMDQRHRLKFLEGDREINFITYRRTLISIMCSALIPERLRIVASYFNNCIYLHVLPSLDEIARKKSQSEEEKKMCAWGYKFEQYVTSDSPNCKPDIEKPVIENAEFSMIYSTQLGLHKLYYGAQIDGMLPTDNEDLKPSDDVEANLNYLQNNSYVELKTNKEIQYWKQEANLKKYKLPRCWCQCYLAGLQGLIMGYRNNAGIVQQVSWFNTQDIVQYCKNEWDPQIALDYLDYFLSEVKDSFKSLNEDDDASVSTEPITLLFDVDAAQNICIRQNVGKDELILPDWYVNSFNE